MSQLFAARYDDAAFAGTAPVESITDPQNVRIRWSLPGGVQRIELTIRGHSELDAYERYINHLGHRIAIYDNFVDRYIGGQVYEVAIHPDQRTVTYICAGPWKRTVGVVYSNTNAADITYPTDDTDVVIKDILDDIVLVSNSDQSNIDGTSLNVGGWTTYNNGIGTFADKAISDLAGAGNSSGDIVDFYFADTPFAGAQLQKPLPYLKARSTTASPDFIFYRRDLAPGGARLSRNIWNLARGVRVGFRRYEGSHTGANNVAILTDAAAEFRGVVSPGDRILNITQNDIWIVTSVDGANQITFDPVQHGGDWDTNDRYTVQLSETQWTTYSTSTETDLWVEQWRTNQPVLDNTQATQVHAWALSQYEKPVQQQSFILGSPTISDGNGARVPLWRALMSDSFYFRFADMYPDAAVFSNSDNRESTFLATALDYEYRTNRLRVQPATPDTRLDVILQQAGLVRGQIASAAAESRAIEDERRRLYKLGRERGIFTPQTPTDMSIEQLRHFVG